MPAKPERPQFRATTLKGDPVDAAADDVAEENVDVIVVTLGEDDDVEVGRDDDCDDCDDCDDDDDGGGGGGKADECEFMT